MSVNEVSAAPVYYTIVGAGMMGQEHIRNIALLDNARVVAVVDPDADMRETAARLAQQLDIGPQSGALPARFATQQEWLASRDTAVNSGTYDCVLVAAPNFTHAGLLDELLATSLPLLVEKPLCTSAEDVQRIAALSATREAPLWVGMEYRYMPPTTRFVEKIRSGAVGTVHMLSIREHRFPFLEKVQDWNRFNRYTGGTLVEKCCHFFDLMRHILASEPVRVFASAGCNVNHLDERYNGEQPDIIDNAFVILDFASGARAMLDLCMFSEGSLPQEVISAVGDSGKLDVNIPGAKRIWGDVELPESQLVLSARKPQLPQIESVDVDAQLKIAGDHHGATYYQHLRFLDVVRHGAPVEVTADDGARAVIMGLAAQESAATGQVVTL